MQGSSALDNYDAKKAEKALKMLFADKSHEFVDLANGIGYPTTGPNWQLVVLNFCLDFSECFSAWSNPSYTSDHMQVHKCNTLMRQIGLGKPNMTEVAKFQNIAYRIAEDFKAIYKRIE